MQRDELLEGRRFDRCITMSVAARMETLDQPSIHEMIAIANISSHGARVVSGRPWTVHDCVVVTAYAGGVRAAAEVVYCQSLDDGRFAIGLKFNAPLVGADSRTSREF